jgi:sucrose phosphorylase
LGAFGRQRRLEVRLTVAMHNGVHLITYADRLAGTISGLREALDDPLPGFAGVHVLPFFTPFDGDDAGFDPVDHLAVDPRLGTWDDVAALAGERQVMADLIVNHISADSTPYQDWLAHGRGSRYDGMFLTFDRVFPTGATEADLTSIYRPRPGLPFQPVVAGGERRLVWNTFCPTQIDLDVTNPRARAHLHEVLVTLAAAGVTLVRLDAVGYAIKTQGTDSFLTDDTMAFIDELTAEAHGLDLEVLVEYHGHHRQQLRVAPHVDRVYDFGLPPLVLHALSTGRSDALERWFAIRPENCVTVLDTHDGIGLVDVAADNGVPGLLDDDELDTLAQWVHANTGGVSQRASRYIPWSTVPYQLNSTYFDALGRDANRMVAARALQLFSPGVPQVYYAGLLAMGNDTDLFERTGVGRDVNRPYLDEATLAERLTDPLVQASLALVRLRGSHRAFRGTPEITFAGPDVTMTWQAGLHEATLRVDLAANTFELAFTEPGEPPVRRVVSDVDSLAGVHA